VTSGLASELLHQHRDVRQVEATLASLNSSVKAIARRVFCADPVGRHDRFPGRRAGFAIHARWAVLDADRQPDVAELGRILARGRVEIVRGRSDPNALPSGREAADISQDTAPGFADDFVGRPRRDGYTGG
jgi:hypothetical protein